MNDPELSEAWSELLELLSTKEVLLGFGLIFFCVLFFSYRRVYKNQVIKQRKKAAKIDMKNRTKWYRELPATYSPAVMSLLCDFHEELHKDLPGVILYLCVKGYIDINDDGKEILFTEKNTDLSDLLKHEKYVLGFILDRFDKFDNNEFRDLVISDAQDMGLLVDKDNNKYKGRGGISIWSEKTTSADKFLIFGLVTTFFLYGFIRAYSIDPSSLIFTFTAGLFFGIVGILMSLFVYSIVVRPVIALFMVRSTAKAKAKSEFYYLRTEKGSEDYKNWLSFKQFLEDFSLINERDFNEIYLWEYYLAYATSLGIADQILKTTDSRIINNKKFKITNYNNFLAGIDRKKSF